MKTTPRFLIAFVLLLLALASGSALATTVNIASPLDAATVSGTVTISGTSDLTTGGAVGISIDGAAVFNTATGRASWTYSWNTTTLTNGNHTITARARTSLTDPAPGLQTITVNVQNGTPNTAPTITGIAAQSINVNTSTAALAFTVGDAETAAASLTVTAASSNPALLPLAGIALVNNGASRTVTLTPAANQTGAATVTLSVSDGTTSTNTGFTLTVSDPTGGPTVVITSPVNGATLNPNITQNVTGTSTNADKVEVSFNGGVFLSVGASTATWDFILEMGGSLPNGSYPITARATSSSSGTTATATVTINSVSTSPGTGKFNYVSSVDAAPLDGYINVPDTYNVNNPPTALVIHLHGGGANTEGTINTNLINATSARGWITIGPNGRKWSVCDDPATPEVDPEWKYSAAYVDSPTPEVGPGETDILDAIAWAQANYNIDPSRIYLTGFSMGGRGAYLIGLRHPDLFAAIAPQAPASDMYSIFVAARSTECTKEAMVGGTPGLSPLVDTYYTITSARFLIENAYNLPVHHSHGTTDTQAFNDPTDLTRYLHGYHMVNNTGWTGSHGAHPTSGIPTPDFGHTPTLSELRAAFPQGYEWSYFFTAVAHTPDPKWFNNTPVATAGNAEGTEDPLAPGNYLGIANFLERHTLVTNPATVVYKTYTDTHRRAYWTEIDSGTPWMDIPAAIVATRTAATNRFDVELARVEKATFDLVKSGLALNTTTPVTVAITPMNRAVFDPALNVTGEVLTPRIALKGDFSALASVTATFNGAPVAANLIAQTAMEITVGPLPQINAASTLVISASGAPPATTLGFSAATYPVNENAGAATITLARTSGTSGAVSVDYATSNGTATAGSDYTAASGTLNWADGDGASKTFTVSITSDLANEADETVMLTLGNATGGAALGTASATLTIVDDDPSFALAVSTGGTSLTGTSGAALNATLTASGGAAPYVWSITGGALPSGITLSSAGVLSGSTTQTGTFTFTVQATDAGGNADTQGFTLTVSPPPSAVNHRPFASWIPDLRAEPGIAVPVQNFTVDDAETAAGSLVIAASSSNQTLLPDANIALGGSGANRTATLTPAAGQSGLATITLTVTDAGGKTYARAFTLTVAATDAANTAPVLSGVPNETIVAGSTYFVKPLTVRDLESTETTLTLSATSSNTALVDPATGSPLGVVFGGNSYGRTITVNPKSGQSGRAVITVSVSDGANVASTAFVLDVVSGSTPPSITGLPTFHSPLMGAAPQAVAFTAADTETAVADLRVTATSSNTALLPDTGIVVGGSGANRTITLTPASGQTGAATVTLVVSDGDYSRRAQFLFVVNDPAASAAQFSRPRGVFVLDSGAAANYTTTFGKAISLRDSTIRSHAFVDGFTLRVAWDDVESGTTPGTYDFFIIQNALTKLPAGQRLSIIITPGEPDYIAATAGVETWSDEGTTRATPWDPYVRTRRRAMLAAMGSAVTGGVSLRDEPRLDVLDPYLPGGFTGIRDPNSTPLRNLPGYTRQKMLEAVQDELRALQEEFPGKFVQIGFWPITDNENASYGGATASEWIRQQLLAEFDGRIRPRAGFFMENLAAKRNGPALDPYSATPVTSFASALFASRDATWNGFQMLGNWTRPFNDSHVANTLNGTPNDAMEAAFNTYRAEYHEVYISDIDNAEFQPALQRWHDFFATGATTSAASDEDGDGLPLWWEQQYGLSPTLANDLTNDDDHDGLGLLLEYAFNQTPLANSSAGLPVVSAALNPGDGQTYLTYLYLRRTGAPQLTYTVEVSDDLITWNSGPAFTTELSAVATGDGVTNLVTVRILPAISGANTKLFARVRINSL